MKMSAGIVFSFLFSTSAQSAECENLIALSRLTNQTTSDESLINSHSREFCKEYSHHKQTGSSFSAEASYKFLSGSAGRSKSSIDDVASQYCSADQSGEARKDSQRLYYESIAPGAFDAYTQCIKASSTGIRFDVEPATVLPDEFSISATFVPNSRAQETTSIAYSASKGISCKWNTGGDGSVAVLSRTSTVTLACTRTLPNDKGFIRLSQVDGTVALSIPLPAHNAAGIPVVDLDELSRALDQLESRLQRSSAPVGSVVFSLATPEDFYRLNGTKDEWRVCDGQQLPPDSPYAKLVSPKAPDLRGLFLRGLNDMGSTSGTPPVDASRANPENKMTGEFQSDALAAHSHEFFRGAYGDDQRSFPSNPRERHFGSAQLKHETLKAGDKETRPKNVSGFFYVKIR